MNSRGLLYSCAGVCGVLALGAVWMAASNATWVGTLNGPASGPYAGSTTFDVATTTPDTYFVAKVVDGDTIDVYMGSSTTRLRLIGMDTPEVVDPRKPVQCFGREASAEGHKLMENQWVRLQYDAVTGKKDIYGRTLAYVFLPDRSTPLGASGISYNEFMIRNGFAREYDYQNQKYEYRAQFQAAQKAAQSENLGFWSPSTCNGNTTKPAGAQ